MRKGHDRISNDTEFIGLSNNLKFLKALVLPVLPCEQDKVCDAEQCQERLTMVMITELQLKDDNRKKYLGSL